MNLSVTEESKNFNRTVLLDLTLNKACKLTELEYYTHLLSKKDLPPDELVTVFDLVSHTYMVQLALVGRLSLFDPILLKLQQKTNHKQGVVKKLLQKCLRIHHGTDAMRKILKQFVKHKKMFERLCELGIEQQQKHFNKEKTQQLIDYFLT